MKDERNPRLYWAWFALFISLTAIAGMITMILLPVFGHMASEPLSNLSLVSVVLGGIPMMAIYGFVFGYFPGYSYNQILRGNAAAAWNILLLTSA